MKNSNIVLACMLFSLFSCGEFYVDIPASALSTTPVPTVIPVSLIPWIKQLGAMTKATSTGNNLDWEECYAVTSDSHGNVYCAGYTYGSMADTNGGSGDAFIMKLDANGTLQWSTQIGSTSRTAPLTTAGEDYCTGISVDTAGNVYCGGSTYSNLGETNGGGGGSDAFVLKLTANGALEWITQIGATARAEVVSAGGNERCNGISVDSLGNVYCGGNANGNFGEVAAGGGDVFILKLDPNGNLLWLTQLGSVTKKAGVLVANQHGDTLNGVSVDSDGNVFGAGYTHGNLGEDQGGEQDAFVVKLDTDGNFVWLTQLGTPSMASAEIVDTTEREYCNGVSVDKLGNVYCAGQAEGDFGEASGGGEDAFVMKLDPSGSLLWVTQLGSVTLGAGSSGWDVCNGVSVDNLGNAYCAGYTWGAMGETNGGDSDAFVMKLDTNGNSQWLTQLGASHIGLGAAGEDFCYGVSVDISGNVYCAGSALGSLGEGNGGGGNADIFVLKLTNEGKLNSL